MSGNWQYNIKHVQPGEPVQAGIVGRPDRTLEERTEYLKDRLDAAELGRAIFEVDATISPDVEEGHAVYWNWTTQRYEKALVAVELDDVTQVFTVQPSSDCVGMCYHKKSNDRADIVLRGLVTFNNLDNSIGPQVAPGKYYLSAVDPGKLSKQKPPVTVIVCHVQGPRDNCSDKLRVIVMPQSRDYVEEHTHYRFDLVPRPAGTNTIVEDEDGQERHVIADPNAEMQGWLPASHPTFRKNPDDPTTSVAPPGALFGYNIKKHTALNRVWPPIPIQSVSMIWDKGQNHVGATEIPLGKAGLAVCDVNGIWWMSDCYGDVPWPADYNPNTSFPNNEGDECPRGEVMRVVVIYLRMLLGNDRTVVTSLVQDTDQVGDELIISPVAITNCDDLPASTGDLKLNVDLQIRPQEAIGGQVIKNVVNRHQLTRGWVAEGVVTTTPDFIVISGSRPTNTRRNLSTEEKTALGITTAANVPVNQGLIRIDYTDNLVEREISPQIIRLSDTVERLYMDIPYLGFPAGQSSLLRVRLNVPEANVDQTLIMKIRVRLFGRAGNTNTPTLLPELYMSYRRLPRPRVLNETTGEYELTALQLPTVDSDLDFSDSARSLLIDHVVECNSAEFDVEAGDTVLVTIERRSDIADQYDNDVGVLRIAGIVRSATT